MRAPARHLAAPLLVATLLVVGIGPVASDKSIENVTVYESAGAQFDDAASIDAAIENGSIQPANRVLVGENLVVAVRSERLATELQNVTKSRTERFFDVLANRSVSLHQFNSNTHTPPKYARLGPANTTVYASDEWTYIIVDTSKVAFYRGSGQYREETRASDGDAFLVAVGNQSGPRTENQSFRLFETPVELFAWDRYDPLPAAVVEWSVEVNITPTHATNATIRLEDGRTATTRIEPNESTGWDRIRFDLRNVANGTDYTVLVVHDGTVVDRLQGTVTSPNATLENLSVRNGTDGLAVRLDATLSHGGGVTLINEYGWKIDGAPVDRRGNRTSVAIHRDSLLTDELLLVAALPDPAQGYYRNPMSRSRVFPENETVVRDAPPPPTPKPAPIPATPATPVQTTPTPTPENLTGDRTDASRMTPGADGAGPIAVVLTVFALLGLALGLWRHR